MNPRKNPTIRDVAKAAGVSIATVSKFVNGQQTFSSSVEAKLKSAIERASWNPARIKGLKSVFDEAGVERTIFSADEPTSEAGERAAARVLLGSNRPEVVIGCNDLVAIGLMAQAKVFGLKVPEDVAIVGTDNISTSRYVSPSLTTVDSRSEKVGEIALRQVLQMIEGHDISDQQRLEPLLVVRESTKRAPTRDR